MTGIIHIGNTPASGHYRSFLSEPLEHPGLSALQHARITDDGQHARLMSPDDASLLAKANVYLVWCAKCQAV